MNALKPGLLDVVIIAVVLLVLCLPGPAMQAKSGLSLKSQEVLPLKENSVADMALLQYFHYINEETTTATSDYIDQLIDYGHLDHAIRVAGKHVDSKAPNQWQRRFELAGALAERFEVFLAIEQAEKALELCQAEITTCRLDQKSKIEIFLQDLRAAQKALDKGLDPKTNANAFRKEMNKHKSQLRIPNINL